MIRRNTALALLLLYVAAHGGLLIVIERGYARMTAPQAARCLTDTECMRLHGGDGSPMLAR